MQSEGTFGNETNSTEECPYCHDRAMTVEAINTGIFLDVVFVRYSCRRCGKTSDAEFPSIEEFARSKLQAEPKLPRGLKP